MSSAATHLEDRRCPWVYRRAAFTGLSESDFHEPIRERLSRAETAEEGNKLLVPGRLVLSFLSF